jgi:hypothetical protein
MSVDYICRLEVGAHPPMHLLHRVYPSYISNSQATAEKLKEVFPKALTNKELVHFIKKNLRAHGYGGNSLVATSLCCDEVNRVLENDLKGVYGSYFSMGGLAGTPFGGVTAFGAM